MDQVLKDVLENYIPTRAKLQGRATIIDSPDQRALLRDLPALIKNHLAGRHESHLFKVEGSIGNGNIARVPVRVYTLPARREKVTSFTPLSRPD